MGRIPEQSSPGTVPVWVQLPLSLQCVHCDAEGRLGTAEGAGKEQPHSCLPRSKVPGATGNVAGINPEGCTGCWGGLGLRVLLPTQGSSSQWFLRWALWYRGCAEGHWHCQGVKS